MTGMFIGIVLRKKTCAPFFDIVCGDPGRVSTILPGNDCRNKPTVALRDVQQETAHHFNPKTTPMFSRMEYERYPPTLLPHKGLRRLRRKARSVGIEGFGKR
jgi:hypothetical protein